MTAKAARRGGRPSRKSAEGIEDRIIDAARVLFFAHGYGATSVENICKDAGIAKRTFYHRFANKPAVFRAVVERLIGAVTPGNVGDFFEGPGLDEILYAISMAVLHASLSPDVLALNRLILTEATRFPELAAVMSKQGARQDAVRRISGLLDQAAARGEINIADTALAAEMFLQLVIGVPQRRALGLGQKMTKGELAAWARAAVDLFVHGCGRAEGPSSKQS